MKIPKKPTIENLVTLALSEEQYEGYKGQVEGELCQIICLIFVDTSFVLIRVDPRTDSLEELKGKLHEIVPGKSQVYDDVSLSQQSFAYYSNESFLLISQEHEKVSINELLVANQLDAQVSHKVFTLYLLSSEKHLHTFTSFPNEIFNERAHVKYPHCEVALEKIIIGRIKPRPEVIILNGQGDIEGHIKLKQLEFTADGNNSVSFKSEIESIRQMVKNIDFKFIFPTSGKRDTFLIRLREIVTALNPVVLASSPTLEIKQYQVKKVNRYGFNQKRRIWFDNSQNSFNICHEKGGVLKKFAFGEIKGFVRTGKPTKIFIEFLNSKTKKLAIIFATKAVLDEFLGLAQVVSAGSEPKSPVKDSRVTLEINLVSSRFRRFTWLDQNNTAAVANNSVSTELCYNVIQKGRISYEKISLSLDMSTRQLKLMSQFNEVIKVADLTSVDIETNFKNLSKLELSTYNTKIYLIFPSTYSKYHFISHYLMAKYKGKIVPREIPISEPLSVYTSTWNLGSFAEPSKENLQNLLEPSQGHKIVALAFQQCQMNSLNSWIKNLTGYFHEKDFFLASSQFLHEMFLLTFVHKSLENAISNVKSQITTFGETSNKGGIFTSFNVESTSFCFLNCHLSSGVEENEKRKQECMKLLQMRSKLSSLDPSLDFDYFFWMGDFNYCIHEDLANITQALASESYSELRNLDQLLHQMSSNTVLSTLIEGPIEFLPTYPIDPISHGINLNGPIIGWNGRILFKTNKRTLQQTVYSSIDNCKGSNHRPIFSAFNIEVRYWFVPETLPPISQSLQKSLVRFKVIKISTEEEVGPGKIFLSFYSSYLESYPKPVIGQKINSRDIEFLLEKDDVVSFVNASSSVLSDQRLIILLNKSINGTESEVVGIASAPLDRLIGDFHSSGSVAKSPQKVKRINGFESQLELNSKVIGKISGLWKYKQTT